LHAPRRAEVPRRHAGHDQGRAALDQSLGRPPQRRQDPAGLHRFDHRKGRQDLRVEAEGALRPRHRHAGPDRRRLHHAREGSHGRSDAADHRGGRVRSLHPEARRVGAGQQDRLHQE
ncbi:Uncharacterized protein APZ42_005549, partial [Daphnia magna]